MSVPETAFVTFTNPLGEPVHIGVAWITKVRYKDSADPPGSTYIGLGSEFQMVLEPLDLVRAVMNAAGASFFNPNTARIS